VALPQRRQFSAHASLRKGIMPDTSNPDKPPTKTETKFAVAELSDAEYNDLANEYLNDLLEKFETLQDNGAPIDVEYSVRFLVSSSSFSSLFPSPCPINPMLQLPKC
jgi:frataxin